MVKGQLIRSNVEQPLTPTFASRCVEPRRPRPKTHGQRSQADSVLSQRLSLGKFSESEFPSLKKRKRELVVGKFLDLAFLTEF